MMKLFTKIGLAIGVVFLATGNWCSLYAQQPARPLAFVERFVPKVELFALDEEGFPLDPKSEKKEVLYSGDTLRTDKKGYALVKFMDNTIAKVKPQSMLIVRGVEQPNSRNTNKRIDLEKGDIFLEVEPQGAGSFEVATSRSVASVKGTRFGGSATGYVWVREGQVDVTATNSGQTVSLFEQMFAQVDPTGNNIQTGALSNDELNSLEDDYDVLNQDMTERTVTIRFRDANGQVRTVEVRFFEKDN